jgi:hypothetical protein
MDFVPPKLECPGKSGGSISYCCFFKYTCKTSCDENHYMHTCCSYVALWPKEKTKELTILSLTRSKMRIKRLCSQKAAVIFRSTSYWATLYFLNPTYATWSVLFPYDSTAEGSAELTHTSKSATGHDFEPVPSASHPLNIFPTDPP